MGDLVEGQATKLKNYWTSIKKYWWVFLAVIVILAPIVWGFNKAVDYKVSKPEGSMVVNNINVNNPNLQGINSGVNTNLSCEGKDALIQTLNRKIAEQNAALKSCNPVQEESPSKELEVEYNIDFINRQFILEKGRPPFTGDSGRLTIQVFNNENNPSSQMFYVEFSINGQNYRKNTGEKVTFTHENGKEYTLKVVAIDPPTFIIYPS